MGSSFNNINIRKRDGFGLNEIKNSVCNVLNNAGFSLVEDSSNSDGSCFVLCGENSEWFTVCSDLLFFETPDDFKKLADVLSAELDTDVMGVACFDSDLLYLNLINYNDKTNAWAGVGNYSEFGINRRNNFSAWSNKVTDVSEFTRCIRKKYIFAEEVLQDVAPFLILPSDQSTKSFADSNIVDPAVRFYFKKNEENKNVNLPVFSLFQTSHIPFKTETRSYVSFLNQGRASKGVYLYFTGDYVENDEITFSDVKIGNVSVELEKVCLSNGKWAYKAYCPNIKIPAIDKKSNGSRLIKANYENCITAYFAAHGNQRKMLDITVVLIPEENWNGQGYYYVWRGYTSKREYIRENNARVLERNQPEFFLMNEEDYDL